MSRIAWIDHAKGLCIVLVVVLYAAGMAEEAAGGEGWLQYVVSFAQPFRMPGFFLVSGLLLSFSMAQDWRTYLDRKVVHFAYFYLLWLVILIAFEAPWLAAERGWSGVGELYLRSLVRPYSMLWFIYLLPVFFLATRLLRQASPAAVWLLAAVLQAAQLDTDIKVLDRFSMYFVYFYTGYAAAPRIFALAERVRAHPAPALAGLGAWGLLNAWLVFAGHAALPVVSLALALLGSAALVAGSALFSPARISTPLAYCGRQSLIIYLAFFIPLTLTHKLLFKAGWIADPGWAALVAAAGGIGGALALHHLAKGTRLAFLFERPACWFISPAAPRRVPSGAAGEG